MIAPPNLELRDGQHHVCRRGSARKRARLRVLGKETQTWKVSNTFQVSLASRITDGCLIDGIAVATGCWVGNRTLRVVDYGKSAATFVDTATQRAPRASSSGKYDGFLEIFSDDWFILALLGLAFASHVFFASTSDDDIMRVIVKPLRHR